MSKLKDFPTDDDYNSDPRYYLDFIRKQEIHRENIMMSMCKAGDKGDLETLRTQILFIGMLQTKIKTQLLKNIFGDKIPRFNWSGKLQPKYRQMIMETKSKIPKWQRKEMLYVINENHKILKEIDKIYIKRRDGR